jgi:8-oxo-dGTP pyrophosphatase MutT (NUDIX family)
VNTYRASILLFHDVQGHILLQERKNIRKWDEEWGFFGGGIELGETPEQALVREIREELEYDLRSYSFLKEVTVTDKALQVTINIFLGPLPDLNLFTLHEGSGMKLFSLPEARKLNLIPGASVVLDELAAYLERE